MHGHQGMINQPLKEFAGQVDIESADRGTLERHIELQARAPGEIDDHARQRLVERHISVSVTAQSLLVAPGLRQRLANGDADILDRMMRIDMQIALGFDLEIDESVARYLIEHMIEKRNAGGKPSLTAAIEIKTDGNPGFESVSANFSLPHDDPVENGDGNPRQTPPRPTRPFAKSSPPARAHDTIEGFRCTRPREPDMSQFWSPLVHRLTPYVPGEQPKLPNLVKLNTNENPYPPSPAVLAALQDELGGDGARLRLYPDPNADQLKAAIAAYFAEYAIDTTEVFVGNGSDEVLAHAFMALLKHDAPLLMPDITYSFYPVYCGLYGIEEQAIPLGEAFEIRIEDYRRDNGGIILANPNAPTGRLLPLPDIERLLTDHPRSVIVIDEAYIDFAGETVPTAIALVKRHPNLLIIRTLSKSHALAGLRIGYAVGDRALIEALERVKNSFNSYPLDRLAIAAASAAMRDTAHLERTRRAVMESRERLVDDLQTLGFTVLPSAANFIFARHAHHDAAELAAALRQKGIIVRHFRQARIDQYLRITIGSETQCQALSKALRNLVRSA